MIPVTFNKDDLQNEKKGTMRAQDLAAMVGLLYPKKVGVLDIFDNPVTITNVDLSTTGYVKLTFSKGYVCAYGRLIYVEQGELVTLPLPASTESGNIGISINLAESGASEVEWFMKSGTLTQNNLLNEPANGVCDIALYAYSANSTSFNLGAKIATVIPSIPDYLAGANFTTPSASDNSNKLATTAFVKSAISADSAYWQSVSFGNGQTGYVIKFGNFRVYGGYTTTLSQSSGFWRGSITYPERLNLVLGRLLTQSINEGERVANVAINNYSNTGFSYISTQDTGFDFLVIGSI